jgi:hypothetical protein
MNRQSFVAKLTKGHGEGSWTRIDIPLDVVKAFRVKGYIQVKGKIDHYEFDKIKIIPASQGKHWLPINERIRKAINKGIGEEVVAELELDLEEVVHEMPEDFSIELQKHPKAETFFNSLTKSYQKWFILSITEAKQADTRKKRIEKAIEKLSNGKKFHD